MPPGFRCGIHWRGGGAGQHSALSVAGLRLSRRGDALCLRAHSTGGGRRCSRALVAAARHYTGQDRRRCGWCRQTSSACRRWPRRTPGHPVPRGAGRLFWWMVCACSTSPSASNCWAAGFSQRACHRRGRHAADLRVGEPRGDVCMPGRRYSSRISRAQACRLRAGEGETSPQPYLTRADLGR